MSETVYASDAWMNEKTNLRYAQYFGHHADETAARTLAQSRENLESSQAVLARSRQALLQARIALGNMEIQNLMAKLSHYTAAQKQDDAFAALWSGRSDVALSFPGFAYQDRQAVQGYLAGLRTRNLNKLEELRQNYQGLNVTQQLAGAGYTDCICLCTPYLVFAEDGQTAQGVWNLMRMASEEVGGQKDKLSNYWFERWHLDFVYEAESWKIWHMTVREDLCEFFDESQLPPGPMELRLPRTGGNSPPGNINMAGGMPFMMGGLAKTLTAPKTPSYPAPTQSLELAELFAGATRARNDVGTVPEALMHLAFADAQEMGPPKSGKGGPSGPGGPGGPEAEKGGAAK